MKDQQPSGVQLITAERKRQIDVEGYDAEHDDGSFHQNGELALAAICYATPEPIFIKVKRPNTTIFYTDPYPGNWLNEYDKRKRDRNGELLWPKKQSRRQTINDLVKAGALIAAEIDRLLRLKSN